MYKAVNDLVKSVAVLLRSDISAQNILIYLYVVFI